MSAQDAAVVAEISQAAQQLRKALETAEAAGWGTSIRQSMTDALADVEWIVREAS